MTSSSTLVFSRLLFKIQKTLQTKTHVLNRRKTMRSFDLNLSEVLNICKLWNQKFIKDIILIKIFEFDNYSIVIICQVSLSESPDEPPQIHSNSIIEYSKW